MLLAVATETVINYAYLLAAVLFIVGLKMLSQVPTAARGNLVSSLGMLIAAGATLFRVTPDSMISLTWIAVALLIGAVIGLVLALRVPMTGMPQMVALFNGFGGIGSLLVGYGDYLGHAGPREPYQLLAIGLTVLVGGVTFTGSVVAFGKLQGLKITPSAPIQFAGQKTLISLMLLISLALSAYLIVSPAFQYGLIVIVVFSLILGVLLVIGIGGADMPVVISLLNSYSGIAAAMAGFVLDNQALIITGALVGASGIILTNIMCKAMNRSLANVLFGGVGGAPAAGAAASGGPQGTAREVTAEDVAVQLDAASQVIIVPGYGMAVAQAQHSVRELADQLEQRNIKVLYAIHPVAGRMPGHMNVLLAEANVPYEQLLDLDQVNPEFEQTDVSLVIGANDVTNPAARHAKDSPIYGMPILDVDKSRSVVVIKRSLNPGFAGVENELYFQPNCAMLFGDGKAMVNALTAELKQL
jgi:NAD(P) transhydrogenase subunit beta